MVNNLIISSLLNGAGIEDVGVEVTTTDNKKSLWSSNDDGTMPQVIECR